MAVAVAVPDEPSGCEDAEASVALSAAPATGLSDAASFAISGADFFAAGSDPASSAGCAVSGIARMMHLAGHFSAAAVRSPS